MSEKEIMKICSNCGSENDLQNETCDVCGALLEDGKTKEVSSKQTEEISHVKENKVVKEKKIDSKKVEKKKNTAKDNSGVKEVNPTKLYYIIGVLLIIGVIVIFASGIFDEPKASANISSNLPNDHNHSGVDLSAVQKINDMEQALKANPSDHETLLHLAHLLNDSGFYDRAIVKYKEYLKTHTNEPDVLVDLGVCFFSIKDYANAEKYMKDALKIAPNHQIANFNLGIVAINQNKNNEAISYWNKAIEMNPTSEIATKAKDLINQYQ